TEFVHGDPYSGHPLACAAGLATLGVYRSEGLFERAASLAPYWENAVHSLRGSRHVIDIRTIGIVAGIELEARSGAVGARGYETFVKCFETGVLVRVTADTIALSPPLIVEEKHIDRIIDVIGKILKGVE